MSIAFSSFSICLWIIFFLTFIILSQTKKKSKIWIIFSCILLSVLAAFFNPIKAWMEDGNYTDLYRFYYEIEQIRNNNFSFDINLKTDYETIPIIKALVFVCAKLNWPFLLPSLSCLIVYAGFAKVLDMQKKDYNIKEKLINTAYCFFLILINYLNMIYHILIV